MKAADAMRPDVITIAPDASVLEAARVMLQNRISGLPVVDGAGRLVGIVTEGDFLRRAEIGTGRKRPRWLEFLLGPGRLADEYVHTHARKVQEVMTPDPVTVEEETPLDEVVRVMERRRVKRVPVTRGDRIVGIISRANLMYALASVSRQVPGADDDGAIRSRIVDELGKQPWAPAAGIDVTVRNGIVELWGCILEERQRGAVKVLAENTPGVKEVRDHLVWVEPVSGTVIEPPRD